MYSDAFPAVSPYAAGKLKFLFFEGKDIQTKAIPKKTAGKASKKTEARQSTVITGTFQTIIEWPNRFVLDWLIFLSAQSRVKQKGTSKIYEVSDGV